MEESPITVKDLLLLELPPDIAEVALAIQPPMPLAEKVIMRRTTMTQLSGPSDVTGPIVGLTLVIPEGRTAGVTVLRFGDSWRLAIMKTDRLSREGLDRPRDKVSPSEVAECAMTLLNSLESS